MEALVRSAGELRYDSAHPSPLPEPGESRVRVLWAGVCGTDLEIARGYGDFEGIPGHEFSGVVDEECGGNPGERLVVGAINASCGKCPTCLQNMPRHCPHRSVLGIAGRDGAFAEQLVLPSRNLLPLPEGFPPRLGVFVEPLAAAFEIPEQIPDLEGRRTLVLGDGRLATLAAQVLRLSGAEVHVLGRHEEKLGFLRALGLEACVEAPGAWKPQRFEIVVEATGRAASIPEALDWVRPRGTLVLKTTVAGPPLALPLQRLVIDEITILGSRCGPMQPAIDALAAGSIRVPLDRCADYVLEDFEKAFADTREQKVFKAIFRMGGREDESRGPIPEPEGRKRYP